MKIHKNIIIAFTALCPFIVNAQNDITGTWHGTLSVTPQAKLRVVFHIDPLADIKAKMDSPDQAAIGMPGELRFTSPDSVNLAFPAIGADFCGRLSEGAIKGKFSQRGISFPLELAPGEFEMKRPQTPVPPFPYSTEETAIPNPDAEGVILAGTLTIPANASNDTPLAVLVSGSGLQNRDEEIMGHKPFAVIADALARKGIATFRYDDRGFAQSTGDPAKCTTADNASDAAAALRHLRSSRRFGKSGIIGHSEGAQIAFMLAADGKTRPDFIVGLGTPAVRGDSVLVDQTGTALTMAGMPKEWTDAHLEALRKIYAAMIAGEKEEALRLAEERIEATKNIPPMLALSENLRSITEIQNPWLIHFYKYSPADDIIKTSCPALALYGEKDIQVHPTLNKSAMEHLNPKVKTKLYPNLNHLFQHAQTGAVSEYSTIEETVSPEVLQDIVGFIRTGE